MCVSYRVVGLGGDDLGAVRVPQHQVGIWTHSNATFAGVKVEDLGGVGAGHGHKLVLVHLARHLKPTGGQSRISTRAFRSHGPLRNTPLSFAWLKWLIHLKWLICQILGSVFDGVTFFSVKPNQSTKRKVKVWVGTLNWLVLATSERGGLDNKCPKKCVHFPISWN